MPKAGPTHALYESLDRPAIVAAIRRAEALSRGEIRVHLHEGRLPDPRAEAERVFVRLGMANTALRTGCLVFVAPDERALVVLGDSGIHERVGDAFWAEARDAALGPFSAGRFTDGIVAAVEAIGAALARHFPLAPGAPNPDELPDTLSESGP